jgi:ATP phosphoribosyltransferase
MKKLSIAVPNGSMESQVIHMLPTLMLYPKNGPRQPRQYRVEVAHPLIKEVVFMPPQHMPRLVAEGKYDLAICGLDLYREWCSSPASLTHQLSQQCKIAGRFDWTREGKPQTRVAVIVEEADKARSVNELPKQTKFISEYPELTRCWLREKGLSMPVDAAFRSTEAHVPRDYRAGVCLVESGDTLKVNSQRILEVIMQTQVVLLANIAVWKTSNELMMEQLLNRVGFKEGSLVLNSKKGGKA